MRLSIIIPVYNERATIAEVLTRVQAVELDTDVVIVDDASTDGTSEWLKEWVTRQSGDVILRRHGRNQGKGAAIRTGLATVTGDYVVIQDGDLEYDDDNHADVLPPPPERPPLRLRPCTASRRSNGASRPMPVRRSPST